MPSPTTTPFLLPILAAAPTSTPAHPPGALRHFPGAIFPPVLLLSLLLAVSPPARAQFTQQGGKLNASDAVLISEQGSSGALSADGSTALVGGPFDNPGIGASGAAWVYLRNSAAAWAQQGLKLVGNGGVTPSQGSSVALSADGNTALVGGPQDESSAAGGAVWVFTRTNGAWSQQGSKLVPSDPSGSFDEVGTSVALAAD